jgi:hypothetical protein
LDKCWPCQDLDRNEVPVTETELKERKKERKKESKKECEDRNRGIRIITKNFHL